LLKTRSLPGESTRVAAVFHSPFPFFRKMSVLPRLISRIMQKSNFQEESFPDISIGFFLYIR